MNHTMNNSDENYGQRPSIFKMILRVLLQLIGPFEIFIDPIRQTTAEREAKGNLRLFRVYQLLGQKPQGLLGDQETNRPET